MSLLTELQTIGIKTETTQNTAATLTTTDYFHADAKSIKANVVYKTEKGDWARMSLDQCTQILTQAYIELSFKAPLQGCGSGTTAPIDAIFQSSGHTSSGSPLVYAPVSAPASSNFFTLGKSSTVVYFIGSATHAWMYVIKGAVVTAKKLNVNAGGLAMLDLTLRGLYSAPTDAAKPSVTVTSNWEPWQNSALSIHGTTLKGRSLEIDWGIKSTMREDSGSAYGIGGFEVTGREPKIKAGVEAELQSTFDPFAKIIAMTEGVLMTTIGSTAGKNNAIYLPKFQILDCQQQDFEGILGWVLTGVGNRSTGDDWITITQS